MLIYKIIFLYGYCFFFKLDYQRDTMQKFVIEACIFYYGERPLAATLFNQVTSAYKNVH